MKVGNLFILGDSYSTFEGHIPEGFAPYYFISGREVNDVKTVEQTWWHLFIDKTNANLIQNCSWSGTTICNTGYDGEDYSDRSFISRFDKLASEDFFEKNRVDTVIVFGGTNDSWCGAPLGEEMRSDLTKQDLYCVRPAIFYLANRLSEVLPNANVIFVVNTDLKSEVSSALVTAATENGHCSLVLKDIDKQDGHPSIVGMRQICEQIATFIEASK